MTSDSNSVARIIVPDTRSPEDVLQELRIAVPGPAIDLNGVYRPTGDAPAAVKPVPRPAAKPVPKPVAKPVAKPNKKTAALKNSGIVGVIDTGVDPAAASFGNMMVARRSFSGNDVTDLHGTMVASLVAGHGVRFMSANVFARDGSGKPAATADAIAAAVDWLVTQGAPVINLSLSGPPNAVIAHELKVAQDKGVIVVAAAGNDGPAAPPAYPAAYDAVVAVTATDRTDNVYRFANRGNYIMFAAKGVDVATNRPPPTVATVSGTSYAAPVVAGALARRFSAQDAAKIQAAIEALRKRAKDLGAPGRDAIYGYGLIAE